ncbi:hypothetical protein F7R01_00955 [Pseudomonas argentinensis]|uniref:Glycine-rich domain-containing protein n=1 Tax=Phytopseudomonas argentinensis TaxID=289370 RepID=A0A1I3NRZ6_9GAMM|nr:hypothetical protein [Pseudomonas argentinensis]KAB0549824.1 hypothetical protein F7R01_00955 [Pseudomonas argentinensis]SFJ11962.1 hypothetical protein SAMN05216602_3983 [Pseudomonas argentinensis]
MTARRPIVRVGGRFQQLPAGDTLDVPADWDALKAPAIASGALVIDLVTSAGFRVALNQNVTALSFANVPTGRAVAFIVTWVQDATGGRTVVFPASVKAVGGGAPVQPAPGANAVSVQSFYTDDGGATFSQSAMAGALRGIQVFRSNGTWTVPAGCSGFRVEVVGGGAGGQGGDGVSGQYAFPGGGGGGGGRAIKTLVSPLPGTSYSVTVGKGGAGAPAGNTAVTAAAGGTSSFGSVCSATGGSSNGYGVGGGGGMGIGGDYNTSLGSGANGAPRGTDTLRFYGGRGGASNQTPAYGGSGASQAPGAGGNGGGVTVPSEGGTQPGYAGADGIVIVEWW